MILPHSPPDLEFGPLQIWVHDREFPDQDDAWDANWLRITAHCAERGASVTVNGSLLDTVSFLRWRDQLQGVYDHLSGSATLESHEPNLRTIVTAEQSTGAMRVRVEITPSHMEQGHWFEFRVDQTFLPKVIDRCGRIIGQYPVRRPKQRVGREQ